MVACSGKFCGRVWGVGGDKTSQCPPGSCLAHSCACWLPTDVPTLPWSHTPQCVHVRACTHTHRPHSHICSPASHFPMSGRERSSVLCSFTAQLICLLRVHPKAAFSIPTAHPQLCLYQPPGPRCVNFLPYDSSTRHNAILPICPTRLLGSTR